MTKKVYIYDHETGKVIPREERRHESGLQIVSDIEPYRNVIDGGVISSRREHKEFLRRHGVEEVGNEYDYIMRHRGRTPDNDY